jgi:outer membrane immunogenic protein
MRNLSAGIFAASFLLASPQLATAADVAVKAPMAAPAAAAYNWTGIYGGGSLGGAWSTEGPYRFVDVIPNSFATTGNANSWAGSLLLGAQWQWQNIVFGVEGNIYALDLKNTGICPNVAVRCQVKTTQSWTIGPRLGWAFNNWLLYGTGGWASSQLKSLVLFPAGGIVDAGSANHDGWFAGGGVEYALVQNMIVGVEYTHINADEKLQASVPLTGLDDRIVSVKIDTVRARLSVKFNPF